MGISIDQAYGKQFKMYVPIVLTTFELKHQFPKLKTQEKR